MLIYLFLLPSSQTFRAHIFESTLNKKLTVIIGASSSTLLHKNIFHLLHYIKNWIYENDEDNEYFMKYIDE